MSRARPAAAPSDASVLSRKPVGSRTSRLLFISTAFPMCYGSWRVGMKPRHQEALWSNSLVRVPSCIRRPAFAGLLLAMTWLVWSVSQRPAQGGATPDPNHPADSWFTNAFPQAKPQTAHPGPHATIDVLLF